MKKILLFILTVFLLNYSLVNAYVYKEVKLEKLENYILNNNDYKIINKISSKINIIINTKGYKYKPKIIIVLKRVSKKYTSNSRVYKILKEIINNTQKNEIKKEDTSKQINISKKKYLGKFDLEKTKEKWIEWQNIERSKLGLNLYSYNEKLNKTAKEWSSINKSRGDVSHKRDLSDSYYDYNKITSWFKERGVICENINRITHSESIGYSSGQCNSTDCTDNLIVGAKRVFNYYMSEKGQDYDAHYRAISNKLFSKIGFGIDIEKIGNNNYKYYFTTHYCTKLID